MQLCGRILRPIMRTLSVLRTLSVFVFLSFFVAAAWGRSGSQKAVKTIKTEHGDIYDCIDFYKQPAFNHPLLKSHSFHPEMRPSFLPTKLSKSDSFRKINAKAAASMLLKDGGCPRGTVPIRRTNKNLTSANEEYSGAILAIGQTKSDPTKFYNGVGAVVSVYNPKVLPSQSSSAEIILKGGTDTIIAGWTVNPSKYKDTQTRSFVYASAGDMHCWNVDCGFIVVSTELPVDFRITPVSKRGGDIYEYRFFVSRENTSGNWWLQVGMKDPQIAIGFWPQRIFTGLQDSATYAACGGEAFTPATLPPPELGAGHYPDQSPNTDIDAYCRNFIVVDEKNNIVDSGDTERYSNYRYYGAVDRHMRDGQRLVTFGGPY